MSVRENLTGQHFDRLTVLGLALDEPYKKKKWLCRCECGNEVLVSASNLKSGHSRQCKSCQLKAVQNGNITHDQSYTKLYRVWNGIKTRCENPNSKSYPEYGGRGITLCPEWHDAATFLEWAWASGYHEGLEIDRIDNDGGYSPENCRWVPRKNNANNKRNCKFIEHNGESRTIAGWASYYAVNYKNLCRNLSKGYSLADAVQREKSGDRTHRKK